MHRKPFIHPPRMTACALIFGFCLCASYGQSPATKSNGSNPAPAVARGVTSPSISSEDKDSILNRIDTVIEDNAFVPGVDFDKWPKFLASERTDIDDAVTDRDFALAVNKALHKFGFSHIVLITPDLAQARMTEKSVGIGVLLQAEKEGMRVLTVFPGSPAADAGLHAGDLIVEGNGKKPESPIDLQGDADTQLVIKVVHLNGKTQTYKLIRRKYSNIRPETLTWPDKDTAVLTVHTFDLSYNRENVEKLVKEAEDGNAKNLIVDLRSNPGGSILNLMHLMGLLLPPGSPLGTFITRTTVDRYIKEMKGKPTDLAEIARWTKTGKLVAEHDRIPYFKGHIAVLVNGGSGSASEIAAAALQEDLDAPVVGSKTAGAVLVSVMNPLPDGFMLQYPITDYVTADGIRLEGTGVSPVLQAPDAVPYDQPDVAVQKAAMLLDRADLRDERGESASIHQGG